MSAAARRTAWRTPRGRNDRGRPGSTRGGSVERPLHGGGCAACARRNPVCDVASHTVAVAEPRRPDSRDRAVRSDHEVPFAREPSVPDRALPSSCGAGRVHLDHVTPDRPASSSRTNGVRQAAPSGRPLGLCVGGRQPRSSRVAQHLRREVADVLPQLRPGLLRRRECDPETKRGDPSAQSARARVRCDRRFLVVRAPHRVQHLLPRALDCALPPVRRRRCDLALRPPPGLGLCPAPDRARRRARRADSARGVFRADGRAPLVDRRCSSPPRCARHRVTHGNCDAHRDDGRLPVPQAAGDAPDLAAARSRRSWSFISSSPARSARSAMRSFRRAGSSRSSRGWERTKILTSREVGSVSSVRCSGRRRATRSSAKGSGRGLRALAATRSATLRSSTTSG